MIPTAISSCSRGLPTERGSLKQARIGRWRLLRHRLVPDWGHDQPVRKIERAADGLLVPLPAAVMKMWPISRRVNKPENDDAAILEPIEDIRHAGRMAVRAGFQCRSRARSKTSTAWRAADNPSDKRFGLCQGGRSAGRLTANASVGCHTNRSLQPARLAGFLLPTQITPLSLSMPISRSDMPSRALVDIVIVLSERGTQPFDRAWRVGEPRAHVRHGDLADARVLEELDVLACLVLRVREDLGNRVDWPARHLERVAALDQLREVSTSGSTA